MKLTEQERNVAKQLGQTEEAFARGKRDATRKVTSDAITDALTPVQRQAAKAQGMSEHDYAMGLAEHAPSTFAAGFNRARARADAAAENGIKSGDQVKVDPGTNGVATGAISFQSTNADGMLRNGDNVSIDPGDDNGVVKGVVLYAGDDDATGSARVILDGDAIQIGQGDAGCAGIIHKQASGAGASKAKLSSMKARIAELEAAGARGRTKRIAKPALQRSATSSVDNARLTRQIRENKLPRHYWERVEGAVGKKKAQQIRAREEKLAFG